MSGLDLEQRRAVAVAAAVKALRALAAATNGDPSLVLDPEDAAHEAHALLVESHGELLVVTVVPADEVDARVAELHEATDADDNVLGEMCPDCGCFSCECPVTITDEQLDQAAVHDPALVYRDATFSRETRDWLVSIAAFLLEATERSEGDFSEAAAAINDVVARWDANEATEFTNDTEVSPC